MIGDHHQLPPVIKNMAFQKYSNMEQSLFTRFVRLGVPTVDLDAQGRARARSVSFHHYKDHVLQFLPRNLALSTSVCIHHLCLLMLMKPLCLCIAVCVICTTGAISI